MENTPLILIIDDDPAFLEIFGTKLSASGFRVETASGGTEGIEKAKRIKPDLILLDMKMPNMDGAETLLSIKNDAETKDIKVVFLTSLGDPWEESQSLSKKFSKDFGALGYIRKTDDLDTLADKVRAYLR